MRWVLVGLVGVTTLVALYFMTSLGVILRSNRISKKAWQGITARALTAAGVWQISIGMYLGSTGSWGGSIPLLGVGPFLIVSGRMHLWTQNYPDD